MGLSIEWAGQTSEDHRATALLRLEHANLLDMFRRQHGPAPPHVTRAMLEADIAATLSLILRIERDVLFPALPSQYAAMVSACTATHDDLASRAAVMQRGSASITRQNARVERLELLAREHLAAEQAMLFHALERDHPDLNRALYQRLVDARRALCNTLPA